MASNGDAARRWRTLAAEARAVADEMSDARARQIMLRIAEGYEHLARRAEGRAKKEDSS
jgi:hypothetical protein